MGLYQDEHNRRTTREGRTQVPFKPPSSIPWLIKPSCRFSSPSVRLHCSPCLPACVCVSVCIARHACLLVCMSLVSADSLQRATYTTVDLIARSDVFSISSVFLRFGNFFGQLVSVNFRPVQRLVHRRLPETPPSDRAEKPNQSRIVGTRTSREMPLAIETAPACLAPTVDLTHSSPIVLLYYCSEEKDKI